MLHMSSMALNKNQEGGNVTGSLRTKSEDERREKGRSQGGAKVCVHLC